MASRKTKKSRGLWVVLSFILFVIIVVLGLNLLNHYGHINTSWTIQENWDGIKAWWNGLQMIIDIKGWF